MNGSRKVKGQSIVVVALCASVLVALVALAIDGGSALLQRRNMQNGADAATLGVIDLMQQNVTSTCSPTPCHTSFLITNQTLLNRVSQLVTTNRGDVVGNATYTTVTEYHIMAGAPSNADTYQPASGYPANNPVPAYVDGIRVTARIANPTTFARAINVQTIPVSAAAAARLYPTCPPTQPTGDALPMIRFRPTTEDFLRANAANDPCHLYTFWDSQGDFQQMKNLVSMNVYSFHQSGAIQTLAGFDMRNGTSGGVTSYGGARCPPDCADMRGSTSPNGNSAVQDLQNWIYNGWLGQISLTSTYAGTRGPKDRTQQGTTDRPGDWIETYTSGNWGNNISGALSDAAAHGVSVPYFSPAPPAGLGWGSAIDRTVYLWGPERIEIGGSTRDYAQEWEGGSIGWEDLTLSNSGSSYNVDDAYHNGSVSVDRVRLTRAITVRFYANLQGNGGGAIAPPGCSLPNRNSSTALGLILTQSAPGPGGGNCGWQVGGGVYSRLIDP